MTCTFHLLSLAVFHFLAAGSQVSSILWLAITCTMRPQLKNARMFLPPPLNMPPDPSHASIAYGWDVHHFIQIVTTWWSVRYIAENSLTGQFQKRKRCNNESLLSEIHDAPWHVMEYVWHNIDDKCKYGKAMLTSVVSKHAPQMKVRVRQNSHPWIIEEVRRLMKWPS